MVREEDAHLPEVAVRIVRVTGKPPISLRWVDTDKSGGIGEPSVTSRLMALIPKKVQLCWRIFRQRHFWKLSGFFGLKST